MAGYVALVHKDEGTSYGVSFPDVPGCISAGDTLDEALANAAEALAGHLALMREDGDEIPAPRSLEAIKTDPELAEEVEGAVFGTIVPRLPAASHQLQNSLATRGKRQATTGRFVMDGKRDYHVVPNPKGGWEVKREGAGRSSGRFETKSKAMGKGRDLARNARTELVEHGRDGQIRDSDSYGRDPNPPRDKKH